jgi:hypothetical protein
MQTDGSRKQKNISKNAKEIARPLVSCQAFPENVSTSDCPAGTPNTDGYLKRFQ